MEMAYSQHLRLSHTLSFLLVYLPAYRDQAQALHHHLLHCRCKQHSRLLQRNMTLRLRLKRLSIRHCRHPENALITWINLKKQLNL